MYLTRFFFQRQLKLSRNGIDTGRGDPGDPMNKLQIMLMFKSLFFLLVVVTPQFPAAGCGRE